MVREGSGQADKKVGKTEMLIKRWRILRGKEDKLEKDLKESTLSCKKLGKKYGYPDRRSMAFAKRRVSRDRRDPGGIRRGNAFCARS